METSGFIDFLGIFALSTLFLCNISMANPRNTGSIEPGFQATQMNWIDNNGLFLVSNNSEFGFGFTTTSDVTLFLLVIVHMETTRVVWAANRDFPVSNSDHFMFQKNGNVLLHKEQTVVWTTNTDDKGVFAMVLMDSGNLVLQRNDGKVIWQSFDHPSDTLISNQEFKQGMKLISNVNPNNLSYVLEIEHGDMVLSAGYLNPQPYWSILKDTRRNINKNGGEVMTLASIDENSWKFFDESKALLWQFKISDSNDVNVNATWIAVLGSDGFISFFNLNANRPSSTAKVPDDPCGIPEACMPYFICSGSIGNTKCQCPLSLSSSGCKTGIVSHCSNGKVDVGLVDVGTGVDYFALGYVSPLKTDLSGCKASCLSNCSCKVMFYDNSSRNCFLFDDVGSFRSSKHESGLVAFVKMSRNENGGEGAKGRRSFPYVVIIVVPTVVVVFGLLFVLWRYYKRKKTIPESPGENSEEDSFLEGLTGMPTRFTYNDLRIATNNFSVKLGQGGFGSVYRGTLPDGTQLAVKKLEGIGQGTKEFRAEVGTIGSIHHLHLVRLKGFCAEKSYRLLVYEYMPNGSLDKWIFQRNGEEPLLDWETRINIAIGTAKGLAYLHQDCDAKIVHCDIKPENVLLDDSFLAKVSDIGLAKLMTREQSHVFTTLRGTRGYLAPEWITNYAISEKSDVYSYGMLLLEIIGGRKNFDPSECSEKSYLPSYAFKMLEEGKLWDILDPRLSIVEEEDERVYTAIKVALWCIQEDMHLRPSMTKVVQMLEGLSLVHQPPMSSPLGSRLYSSSFKSKGVIGGGTISASAPSEFNGGDYLSAVQLSGPR